MTYPSADENTTELPSWLKWMRGLVMLLLVVSILAMASLIYAAFRIVGAGLETGSNNADFEAVAVDLPEGAEPLGLTLLPDGKKVIIYKMDSDYRGRMIESNGDMTSEMTFQ